jgi:GNAT superfamily N-acetyltransferase
VKPPEEIGAWYIHDLHASVAKHKGRLLVAESEGVVAGYACLLVDVSSADDHDEILYTYSYVADLAVLASHRGHGLGGALLAACESLARAAGQKWIRLGVIAANHDARRFYARSGFAEQLLTLEKTLA